MQDIVDIIARVAADIDGANGKLSAIAVLVIVAKYWLDFWRLGLIQSGLAFVERVLSLPEGMLQWEKWTPGARTTVSLVSAFLLALVTGIASGLSWYTAALAAAVTAFGSKGVHDTGFLPGRRPSPPEPSISRPLSLRTKPPHGPA